jgi:steroid delta-isomerase-like uncharacterized protein
MATILRGFEEIWNKGNVSMMDETWAADSLLYVPIQLEPLRGRETAKTLVKQLRAAFPDFRVTPEDSFAEGNLVVVRYTMRGTHLGDYFGVPATYRTVVSPAPADAAIPEGAGRARRACVSADRGAAHVRRGER